MAEEWSKKSSLRFTSTTDPKAQQKVGSNLPQKLGF